MMVHLDIILFSIFMSVLQDWSHVLLPFVKFCSPRFKVFELQVLFCAPRPSQGTSSGHPLSHEEACPQRLETSLW